MEETHSGVLAPLIVKSTSDLTPSFEPPADGLRAATERGQR